MFGLVNLLSAHLALIGVEIEPSIVFNSYKKACRKKESFDTGQLKKIAFFVKNFSKHFDVYVCK